MTYDVLSGVPIDPEGNEPPEISLEKQKAIAWWAVGKSAEDIQTIANTIGRDRSVIYAWRHKYVVEGGSPPPPEPPPAPPEPELFPQQMLPESPEDKQRHEEEATNGMGKEHMEETKGKRRIYNETEKRSWINVYNGVGRIESKYNELHPQGPNRSLISRWEADLGAKPVIHREGQHYPSVEVKREIIAKADKFPADAQAFHALRKEYKLKSSDKSMISKWRRQLGLPRGGVPPATRNRAKSNPLADAPERWARDPSSGKSIIRAEFKRWAVGYIAQQRDAGITQADTCHALQVHPTDVAKWRRSLGEPHIMGGARPGAGRKPKAAEPVQQEQMDLLSPDDRALLTEHNETRLAKRGDMDELRRLRIENVLLQGHLALARELGYDPKALFDVDKIFNRRSGK